LNSKPIKIGLLLNSLVVPLWVEEIIKYVKNDDRFSIVFVALNQTATKNNSNYFVYKILRYIDGILMKLNHSPFKRTVVSIPGVVNIPVFPIQNENSDYFPEEVNNQIKAFDTDIILQFGFGNLLGDILGGSKFGVLSLHHGEVEKYRGGPPAFWEVFNKSPLTSVSLQHFKEDLEAGKVIERCFLNTYPFSFYRNQHRVFWAGEKMYKEQLNRLADVGPITYFLSNMSISIDRDLKNIFFKTPNNLKSLYILCWYITNNIYRQLHKLKFRSQWQIVFSKYDTETQEKKILEQYKILPPKDREWADPFIISKDKQYYIFLEEKEFKLNKAHISVLTLNHLGELIEQKPIKILSEEHHLSYPFIFQYLGEYYMLPESSASRELTLYKAESFPYNWKKCKVLINDKLIYDPTLYQHEDGNWYLFCTAKNSNVYSSNAYMHIYYTSDLLNEDFQEHSQNPIYNDVRCSRPAGSILHLNGKIYRPYQICAPVYGSGMNLAEIQTLSKTEYREELSPSLTHFPGLALDKSHTLNSAGQFLVTDELTKVLRQ